MTRILLTKFDAKMSRTAYHKFLVRVISPCMLQEAVRTTLGGRRHVPAVPLVPHIHIQPPSGNVYHPQPWERPDLCINTSLSTLDISRSV